MRVLAVVVSTTERYDAGSMALCLAAELTSRDRPALVIDADTAAGAEASLAERLGAAQRRSFEPWVSGMPTLLASRSEFSEQLISEHVCVPDGTDCWLLLGPGHPSARHYAHDWIDRHLGRLRRLLSGRIVLVTASLAGLEARPSSLRHGADAVVMLASGADSGELTAAARRCAADGDELHRSRRMAMVADDGLLADAEVAAAIQSDVVTRLPVRDDLWMLEALRRRQRRLHGPVSETAGWLVSLQAASAGEVG